MIVMTVMRHCHCHASLPCITAMHHCTPLHILAHLRTFALHSSSSYYLLLLFVIIIILWCVLLSSYGVWCMCTVTAMRHCHASLPPCITASHHYHHCLGSLHGTMHASLPCVTAMHHCHHCHASLPRITASQPSLPRIASLHHYHHCLASHHCRPSLPRITFALHSSYHYLLLLLFVII